MKSLTTLREELNFRIALRNAYDGDDKKIWETLHTNVALLQEELNARLNRVGSNGVNGKKPGNGEPLVSERDDAVEESATYSRESE